MKTRPQSWHKMPQLQNWPQEIETNWPWHWRLNLLKQSRRHWSDCQWPISSWLSGLTVRFLRVAPSLSLEKLLPTHSQWEELAYGQESVLPAPPLLLPASNIKQTFFFPHPGLSDGFWAASGWTWVWYYHPYICLVSQGQRYFKTWSKKEFPMGDKRNESMPRWATKLKIFTIWFFTEEACPAMASPCG